MNIALIGYGKMGHEIERIALERGHKIVCIIDIDNQNDDITSNESNIGVQGQVDSAEAEN